LFIRPLKYHHSLRGRIGRRRGRMMPVLESGFLMA